MNLDLLILRRVNASDHWNYLFGHAANSGWIRWVAKPGATSAFHMQDNTGNNKKKKWLNLWNTFKSLHSLGKHTTMCINHICSVVRYFFHSNWIFYNIMLVIEFHTKYIKYFNGFPLTFLMWNYDKLLFFLNFVCTYKLWWHHVL